MIRQQIIDAARGHFSRMGYEKAAVADVASAAGISKAYVYKFFDSKRAIGEALCTRILSEILEKAQSASTEGASAADQFGRFFTALIAANVQLCVDSPRLCDIALDAMRERWVPSVGYVETIERCVGEIIQRGVRSGEFEIAGRLDETTRAAVRAMEIYYNPLTLQFKLDELPDGPPEILRLLLRGLQARTEGNPAPALHDRTRARGRRV